MEMDMQWIHTLTIVGSITTITVGSIWAFYLITANRIDRLDNTLSIINEHHREDIRAIEARFISMDAKFISIDEKWERLFERLLIPSKKGK